MKKLAALFFYAITCMFTGFSCMHNHNGNIDLTFNESDHYYSMSADFSKHKTRAIDEYMDSRVGRRSNMSFVNSRIDGKLALDDHTTFYIKKYPGHIEIKLNKDENSPEAYHQIKVMCEGIKKVLVNKK